MKVKEALSVLDTNLVSFTTEEETDALDPRSLYDSCFMRIRGRLPSNDYPLYLSARLLERDVRWIKSFMDDLMIISLEEERYK